MRFSRTPGREARNSGLRKKNRGPLRTASLGKIFVAGGIMILSLFVYVGYQAHVIELGYQIQHLQKEQQNLRKIHQTLLIETEHLSSLDRIETIAASTLNMVYPSDRDIVLVRRVPHGRTEDPRQEEIVPKIWVAEGKTPNRAGMLW